MIKPISGSWFEFQHPFAVEGTYWNPACAKFSSKQWDLKIKEISELGMEYLVLMAVALDSTAYFDTTIFPKSNIQCSDPIETVLSAADKYGIKFFISNDFFGYWRDPHSMITNELIRKRRLQAMSELAEKYGSHESFYGWYWPNEAFIFNYFSEPFMKYVNECSAEARRLMPKSKTLIAPYGTRFVSADDKYVGQLENLDVDIIAYQDEIGVRKTKVEESAGFYEALRRMHDKAGCRALWADVEIFEFEGNVYESSLIPAEFSRVEKQLEAVSDYVDTILVYQFQGMMNKPSSVSFAGHSGSTTLYRDYAQWLSVNHPEMLSRVKV